MKLDKDKLQQILNEELKNVLDEALPAGWIKSPERRKFYQQWIKDPKKSRWGVGGRKYNDAEVAAAAQWTKSQQPAAKATKSALPPKELHPPPKSRRTEIPKRVPLGKKKRSKWTKAPTTLVGAAAGGATLRKGMRGPGVIELQQALCNAGNEDMCKAAKGKHKGFFGSRTQRAVIAYQKANPEVGKAGTKGIVGPVTADSLVHVEASARRRAAKAKREKGREFTKQYKHKQNIDTAQRWGPEPEKQYYKENQSNLTKPKLQQIIEEEFKNVLNEGPYGTLRKWNKGSKWYGPKGSADEAGVYPDDAPQYAEPISTSQDQMDQIMRPDEPEKKKFQWVKAPAKNLQAIARVGDRIALKWGHQGPAVEELQQMLKEKGFYKGAIDSKFGNHTLAAVKAFQTGKPKTYAPRNRPDGVVGDDTVEPLLRGPGPRRLEPITISPGPEGEDADQPAASAEQKPSKMQREIFGGLDPKTKENVIKFNKFAQNPERLELEAAIERLKKAPALPGYSNKIAKEIAKKEKQILDMSREYGPEVFEMNQDLIKANQLSEDLEKAMRGLGSDPEAIWTVINKAGKKQGMMEYVIGMWENKYAQDYEGNSFKGAIGEEIENRNDRNKIMKHVRWQLGQKPDPESTEVPGLVGAGVGALLCIPGLFLGFAPGAACIALAAIGGTIGGKLGRAYLDN